jgi:hypothetical protein
MALGRTPHTGTPHTGKHYTLAHTTDWHTPHWQTPHNCHTTHWKTPHTGTHHTLAHTTLANTTHWNTPHWQTPHTGTHLTGTHTPDKFNIYMYICTHVRAYYAHTRARAMNSTAATANIYDSSFFLKKHTHCDCVHSDFVRTDHHHHHHYHHHHQHQLIAETAAKTATRLKITFTPHTTLHTSQITSHKPYVTSTHSGAPMLRKYATTSALLFSMAFCRAVPLLQRRA